MRAVALSVQGWSLEITLVLLGLCWDTKTFSLWTLKSSFL